VLFPGLSAAGQLLVMGYIDDGYGGTLLDRPALNQIRADVKTALFDTFYFLAAEASLVRLSTGLSSANC
jgi:hypothetical protein